MIQRLGTASAWLLIFVVADPARAFDEDRNELLELRPSNVGSGDLAGYDVAFDDTTALVGAPSHDVGGLQNAGAVWVFDTGSGTELFELTASDGAAGDQFGISVAVSGNTALIGAPQASGTGVAYLIDLVTQQELFRLTASDGALDDKFGIAVAIDGNTAIVGAYVDDDGGDSSGSAYVFDVVTGQQLYKLTASDAGPQHGFGISVALSGTIAIVGSYQPFSSAGAAYLFDLTTGLEIGKLTPSDGVLGDNFGFRVAIDGNTAVVGALAAEGGQGSAYVYDVATGAEPYRLVAPVRGANHNFGTSVAIEGDIVFVGAYRDGPGAAHSFDRTDGHHIAKMTASNLTGGPRLGISVAMSGTRGIAGAYFAGGGAAYVFELAEDLTPPTEVTDLASTTHTVGVWERAATLQMTWTSAVDAGLGLNGYSYLIDHDPSSIAPENVLLGESATSHSVLLTSSLDPFYFHLRASDVCGNWSEGVTAGPYFVDLNLPFAATSLMSPSHSVDTWSSDPQVALEWTAAFDEHSGLAGYSLSVSAGAELPSDEMTLDDVIETMVPMADGDGWFVNLRSVDVAGNWEDAAASIGPFRIDTTAPTEGTVAIASGAPQTSVLVVDLDGLGATETGSGLSQMQLSNDGVRWSPPEAAAETRGDWDLSAYGGNAFVGTKTVHVRFLDVAGNLSAVFTDTIDFQPGQPEIDVITPNRGPGTGGNTVTITGSGFTSDSRVHFGGTPGAVTFVNGGELRVVVPGRKATSSKEGDRGLAGEAVDVEVRTDYGRDTLKKGYTYAHRR
ncbi:MAG: IPT/TIG domain-containing protein [Planctomycetota bacterium]